MADQIPSLSELVSSVPQIVITQPSPAVSSSNLRNVKGSTGNTSADTNTTDAIKSTPVTTPVHEVELIEVSDEESEFKDPDCSLYEETKDKPTRVDVWIDSQVAEIGVTPEPDQEAEDSFRSISSLNNFNSLTTCFNSIIDSKLMLCIQFLLLSIPISSGFMGAKYIDKCPLTSGTPVFLFMMGIAGTIVIICKILLISQKILLPSNRDWQLLRVIVIIGHLAIIVCLITEMFSFMRKAPSFEPGTPNYCHEIFYNFTYWMNWTCVVVITLLVLIHLPSCCAENFRNELA